MQQFLFIALLTTVIISFSGATKLGRCSGDAYCTACTTCSSCRNCNEYGGTCGVCHPNSKTRKRVYKPPQNDNSKYSPFSRINEALQQNNIYPNRTGNKTTISKKSSVLGDCSDFTAIYDTLPGVVKYIRSYSFPLTGNFSILDTSCIVTKAEYFSCDGESGFLVMAFGSSSYLVQKEVPISSWIEFRNSEMKCNYLKQHILRQTESYIYMGQ